MIPAEAEKLNKTLQEKNSQVYEVLSQEGKEAYFPSLGIIAQTTEAKGTVLNVTVGQAFEDDGTAMTLKMMEESSSSGKEAVLYTNTYGNPLLREEWQKQILKKNPSAPATITKPIVTCGITHGLFIAASLFVDKEDTLIIPEPFWGNYRLIFKRATIKTFPFFEKPSSFNISGLKNAIKNAGNKSTLLLNFPNNPTGYTPTEKEAREIITCITEAAATKEIVVIIDDAYFGLFYEKNIVKESLFAGLAKAHQNIIAIKVDGITKELFAWGLRIGFITFGTKELTPESASVLENKTAGIVRSTISNASTGAQLAALKCLQDPATPQQLTRNLKILKERYETVKQILKQHQEYAHYFEALPFNSGYFMCVQLKQHDANIIRKKLIVEYSTGVIAMGSLLRIAYAGVSCEKIERVFQNVYECCKNA